jgi:hypothetical protein
MPLSPNQRYSVASMLAVGTLASVESRLAGNVEALKLARSIDRYYTKRDGFIPRPVLAIVQGK